MTETRTRLVPEATLLSLHHQAMMNRGTLVGQFGCFHCLSTFKAERVCEWADDGRTALCPVCGVDAVLSSSAVSSSPGLLEAMQRRWFGTKHLLSSSEWEQAVATGVLPRAPE